MIKRSLFLTGPVLNKIPRAYYSERSKSRGETGEENEQEKKICFRFVFCPMHYILKEWNYNLEYLELRLRFSTYLGGNCVSARMNKGVPLRETVKRGAERNTLKRERKREKGGKKEKKIESVDPVVQITKIKGTSSSVRFIYLICLTFLLYQNSKLSKF